MSNRRELDPTHRTFVSYIDKSRDYYLARGYTNPYRWAHFDDVPFAPLRRPLSEGVVTLITTAMPEPDTSADTRALRSVFSVPSDHPPQRLSTLGLFWDREATHTDDLDSYFPVHRLQELARAGRIGRLAARLHGIPTEYSQRRTLEYDAPEVLRRCREDGADAALLVPL
jgi:D-proline reductase (dithiol) PrdB